jgi:hypothetical protein
VLTLDSEASRSSAGEDTDGGSIYTPSPTSSTTLRGPSFLTETRPRSVTPKARATAPVPSSTPITDKVTVLAPPTPSLPTPIPAVVAAPAPTDPLSLIMAKLSGMEESIAKVTSRVLSLETGPVGPAAWGSGYREDMEDVPMTEAENAAKYTAMDARAERDHIADEKEAEEDAVFYCIFRSMVSGDMISCPADESNMEMFPEVARSTFTAHAWMIYDDRSLADLQILADAWIHCLACDNSALTRQAMEELYYVVHDRPASSADPTSLAIFESVHACFCYEHNYDSRENLPAEALRFFRKALTKAEPSPGLSKSVHFK